MKINRKDAEFHVSRIFTALERVKKGLEELKEFKEVAQHQKETNDQTLNLLSMVDFPQEKLSEKP